MGFPTSGLVCKRLKLVYGKTTSTTERSLLAEFVMVYVMNGFVASRFAFHIIRYYTPTIAFHMSPNAASKICTTRPEDNVRLSGFDSWYGTAVRR